jgi:hypothetical protein
MRIEYTYARIEYTYARIEYTYARIEYTHARIEYRHISMPMHCGLDAIGLDATCAYPLAPSRFALGRLLSLAPSTDGS